MKSRRAGLSLIEVIIASAILAVVAGIAMSVLFSSSRTASDGQRMAQLEQRGNRMLAFYREQMSTAAFTHPTYTNLGIVPGSAQTALAYQICGPATVGPTGNAVLQFGYADPRVPNQTFTPTLACFLRFEAETVYQESSASPVANQAAAWTSPAAPAFPVLTTVVLNLDVNNNGSRSDTFVSGRIMKYVVDEGSGAVVGRERLDDQVLLRVVSPTAGTFQGDVDGDGTVDYLFAFTDAAGTVNTALTGATAGGVLLNLWHGCPDESGKRFILRNNKQLIHLRTERN